MCRVELYGLRFNDEQMTIINEFVSRMDGFALVSLHQLANKECELYTYQQGRNRHSYDTFKKFDNKSFLVGYMSGANDALSNNIHFC